MGLGLRFITPVKREFSFLFDDFEINQDEIMYFGKNPIAVPRLKSFFHVFSIESEQHPNYVRYAVWTRERKRCLEMFLNTYQDGLPTLKDLGNVFDSMKENEWFCTLPSWVPFDTDEIFGIQEELYRRNTGKTLGVRERLSPVTVNYNLRDFVGNDDRRIGQQERTKRVCRWCHNRMNDVTFREKAHAISEALGNKNLILLDECDSCNHRFANTIERDVINYFRTANVLYGVRGKNGRTKIKTSSVEITTTDNNVIRAVTDQEIVKNGVVQAPLRIDLGKIIGQNVYKSLCKFALSLIDDETLKTFDWTIDWINGSNKVSKVPIVKALASGKYPCKNVAMRLHVRKNDRDDLPKLFGIFYHTNSVHLLIVPKDKEELDKFVIKENFENFIKTLPYGCEKWGDMDFSSDVEQPFKAEIGFKQKEQGE